MKEFNNRQIANKFAEYITGDELRRYVADKVKKYVGKDVTVFDGACGSGQLEQYVNPKFLYGVEIQDQAVETCKENYTNSEIIHNSFFNHKSNVLADCIIMNPPFSIKFKELSEEEQDNIKANFPWKKSGVVDDIFILKSLEHTKRYGFYICFPGIMYRKSEKKLRELLGNTVQEMNIIENAFEDTHIQVLFLVIDKDKNSNKVYQELYNCKTKKITNSREIELEDDRWERISEPIIEEVIDIDQIEKDLNNDTLNHIKKHLETSLLIYSEFDRDCGINDWIEEANRILKEYQQRYLTIKKSKEEMV